MPAVSDRSDTRPPPVVATVRVASTQPWHGITSFVAVRVVRADSSFILARGATLPEALRHAARAIEEEQAVGPLSLEPRRRAIAALVADRAAIFGVEDIELRERTLGENAQAIAALKHDIAFDVTCDLERTSVHR